MKLIKLYLYSLIVVIIVAFLIVLVIKLGLLEGSAPAYFYKVNLGPEQLAELEKRREDNLQRLELFPNTYEVFIDLGNIEAELGNASKAIEYYKKAWQIIPANSTPWNNIGYIYIRLMKYNEAEAAFLKAKNINPANPLTYLNLTELYQKYLPEKSDSVKGIYLEGLVATDNSEQIMVPLATYLTESGNYSEALLYWQELVEKYPNRQEYQEMIDFINEQKDFRI